jgi:glutathione-regulated potassium-efflux system protein KefB
MSLNLNLLVSNPGAVMLAATGLIALKGIILFFIARRFGLDNTASRRFAVALAQGGEFAFVLTTGAIAASAIQLYQAVFINIVVTVTMVVTPLLMLVESWLTSRLRKTPESQLAPDDMPDHGGHVVIAGLGRFGQIIARVLAARGIPFTALDGDPTQIEIVRRYGGKVYFGDASRPDILEAAQIDKARAFVVCVSDVEVSLHIVEMVRTKCPDLPIYARARDRRHVHWLMDVGVEHIMRETFLSALEMSRRVLLETGLSKADAAHTIKTFAERDRKRLHDDYAHQSDDQKLAESAKRHAEELAELFASDANEKAGVDEAESRNQRTRAKS